MNLRAYKLTVCFLLSAGLLSTAVSQTSPEKLPEGPLILKIPENAAWEITLVDPSVLLPSRNRSNGNSVIATTTSGVVPLKDESEIVQWNFRRAGKSATVEMISGGGGRTSIWGMAPSPVAVKTPGEKRYSIVEIGDEISHLRYGKNDYPHTSIVSLKNFAGRVAANGTSYLIFRKGGDQGSPGTNSEIVLVDEKTHLPYGATEQNKGYLFRILPNPASLVPPGDVIATLQNEKARLNRLNAVPPHP